MKNIYDELKKLTQLDEGFYSSYQEIEGYTIENFSYRLASYEMFCKSYGKEARGIAFIYGKEIKEPELFTLGFHKFFNYGEGDTLEEIKEKEIESIQDKVDGSLIMFGRLPSGRIIAKSKTSIDSFAAEFANKYISEDAILYNFIDKCLQQDIFPIFEYVGPENRIVVKYEQSDLILLGMRKIDGEYLPFNEIKIMKDEGIPHIQISENQSYTSIEELLEKREEDEGYEGFIVNYTDGYKLKIKLQSYVLKHRAKDNIYNEKALIDICLNEETDDLRTLFVGDEESLKLIDTTEKKVYGYYNKTIAELEILLQENSVEIKKYTESEDDLEKRKIRKQIAITNCKNSYFSLLMKKLESKEIDYKEFVRKNIHLENTKIVSE